MYYKFGVKSKKEKQYSNPLTKNNKSDIIKLDK